ncbi:MAG TPA: tRNA (adenosine(37)-N6)-threonylcarbamoyltransferase complex dimerization subunit type 1 TsaB [Propionibacteriaceae bacterium]|nr:tRNA (adenosine(37)-N6)-threonylcarbamoyltransferase complex dimerization subunit type 1 TsaB [Propionibacteriaceae bacterium]
MTPALVLGIDTSTVVCVGLARGGEVLGSASVNDRLAHVEQLTPLIRTVLASAGEQLSAVAQIVVGLGPGPFTGLRVGIATARVLALVTRAPLRGICSLDVLAVQYAAEHPSGDFLVATDARRREVYWARYTSDGRRREGPAVAAPAELTSLPTVGPAADLYPDQLAHVSGPRGLDAGVLAAHAMTLADAGLEPLYLRRPDAAVPSRTKSVLSWRADQRTDRGPASRRRAGQSAAQEDRAQA